MVTISPVFAKCENVLSEEMETGVGELVMISITVFVVLVSPRE
jgi:hypothetical protein